MNVVKIKIDEIKVNEGRRQVNQKVVEKIVNSFKVNGNCMLNPITVTSNHELISGNHRIEAAKILGWTEIEANILNVTGLDAELAEIDENLIRNELHWLEKAKLKHRRVKILREKGLMAKSGDNRTTTGADSAPLKTIADVAEEMGESKRSLQQDIQIVENLTPEAQEAVMEHDIPKEEAVKIARKKPEEQAKVTEMIKSGEAKNVSEAENKLMEKIYSCAIFYQSNENKTISKDILKMKDDSILLIWTTSKLLKDAMDLFESYELDFEYQRVIVWDKNNRECEFCLVGTRGNPPKLPDLNIVKKLQNMKGGLKPESVYFLLKGIEPVIEIFPKENYKGYDKYEAE